MTYCVYPPGARFPGPVKPHATVLIMTPSLIKARNAARKHGTVIECWQDGQPVREIRP